MCVCVCVYACVYVCVCVCDKGRDYGARFVFLFPQMLLNLHKKSWMDGLQLTDYKEHSASNEKTIKVS